jgi:phage portal protein BeeE
VNLLRRITSGGESRDINPYSLSQFTSDLNSFKFNGILYSLLGVQTMPGSAESIEGNFEGLVQGAMKSNGIVWACMLARAAVFSGGRFQWQTFDRGQPGPLFGTTELSILERPDRGQTTQDLLARMSFDVDLAGNAYTARRRARLVRLRPDWVDIVAGTNGEAGNPWDIDAELIGYLYYSGGDRSKRPVTLLAEEVCHFAPYPDPAARFRGMSWLQPIIAEVSGDRSLTSYKNKFMENAATPNLIVSAQKELSKDKLDFLRSMLREKHEGLDNAFKTLLLVGGADAKVVGANLSDLAFADVQGAGEVRIANAAGVPATVLGLSEGLKGSSLNAGNFTQARRSFADRTIDHMWKNISGSMQTVVSPPNSATNLVIDTRYVPFLREDQKDEAEIQKTQSEAISTLVTSGFDPQTAVQAVTAGDLTQLKHTGLVSVQLLPPGSKPEQQQLPGMNGGGRALMSPKALKALMAPLTGDK